MGRDISIWFLNLKQNCNTTRHTRVERRKQGARSKGRSRTKGDNVRFSRAGIFGGLSLVLSATLVGVGGGGASASVRASGPSNVSTTSFTNNISFMKQFKS
jgi:hypothetical protein